MDTVKGPLIEAQKITKHFKDILALSNATFKALPGQVTVIAGPSGSGKSTLLRIIAGLEDPDEGTILFDGADVTNLPPWEREAVMLSQRPILLPHLTILENLILASEARGLSKKEAMEKAVEISEKLGIKELLERHPGTLSGGQLQRASLAAVLASEPRVLLLDEPFAHLDLPLRESFRRLIRQLAKEKDLTVIQVTHDQDEALEMADTLAILIKGTIIEERDPLSIYYEPKAVESAVFLGHNLVCKPPLSRREGIAITFPPEAVELGRGPYTGIVSYIAVRKHHTLVHINIDGVEIRTVLAGVRRVKEGVRVNLAINEDLVREWNDPYICRKGISLYE